MPCYSHIVLSFGTLMSTRTKMSSSPHMLLSTFLGGKKHAKFTHPYLIMHRNYLSGYWHSRFHNKVKLLYGIPSFFCLFSQVLDLEGEWHACHGIILAWSVWHVCEKVRKMLKHEYACRLLRLVKLHSCTCQLWGSPSNPHRISSVRLFLYPRFEE